MADFDWAWPKRIDREAVESVGGARERKGQSKGILEEAGLATDCPSWFNVPIMFYAGMNLPTWAVVAVVASVLAVSATATLLQPRFHRALVFTGGCLVGIVALGIAATTRLRTGSSMRSWLEAAIPLSIMYGLPALTSLLAVTMLRRRARWERVAWGIVLGASAAFFAAAVGLAAACGLTGDCL